MRTSLRWLVPLVVAGTVVGGVAVSSAQAGNAPSVPGRTPQQVLASVAGARVSAMSGTVVTRADLGLPSVQVPGHGGVSAEDPQGLLTRFLSGKNTLRVWTDGPTRQRVQLLDSFDELDVVRNGTQLWTYSARSNEVGKGTAPATDGDGHGHGSVAPSGPADLTPAQMADRMIAAAGPTTSVTLGTPQLVAGRATYSLTLTPRTDATLVDRVVVAVDAEKGVPLQVEVFARGHRTPAVETGFTAVSFSRPAASTFAFTPPKGAKVTELGDEMGAGVGESSKGERATTPHTTPKAPSDNGRRPVVTGTGWASIMEFPKGTADLRSNSAPGGAADSGGANSRGPGARGDVDANRLIDQLTKPVAGGRAFSSRLLSVLVTDDGRMFVGAVPVQALVAAAK